MEPISTVLAFLKEIWAVLVAIVTGIGSFYLGYRRFRREEKENVDNRLDKLYEEIKDENTALRERMKTLQDQQTKLLIDYIGMKTKWETILGSQHKDLTIERLIEFGVKQKQLASTLEEFTTTFPGLLWMKSVEKDTEGKPENFRMFAISQQYADNFLGGNRNSYIGKLDTEIWDKSISYTFKINDERAYNSRVPIHVVETVNGNVDNIFVGWKWNISVEGIDYVCGYGDIYKRGTAVYDTYKDRIGHYPSKTTP